MWIPNLVFFDPKFLDNADKVNELEFVANMYSG